MNAIRATHATVSRLRTWIRATHGTVSRLRTWNADLEAERHRALAEAVMPADLGADGPAARARVTRTEDIEGRSTGSASRGERITARRVVCECQVDTYHAQGHLDAAAHAAGLWFRRRYLLGYRSAVVTAGYGERVAGTVGDNDGVSSRVLDARHDLAQLASVLSMMQWAAVETVAGHDHTVGRGRMRDLVSALVLVAAYRDTVAMERKGGR